MDYLLSGQLLHLTGITALLSGTCRDLVDRLMHAAIGRDVPVSFDVNVRSQLLAGRDPATILLPLARLADIVLLSTAEAALLLGGTQPDAVRRAVAGWRATTVVVHDAAGAYALHDGDVDVAPAQSVAVVDPVGAGDAFAAGYLSGWLRDWPAAHCLRMAEFCAARVVGVRGDQDGLPTRAQALADLDDLRTTR